MRDTLGKEPQLPSHMALPRHARLNSVLQMAISQLTEIQSMAFENLDLCTIGGGKGDYANDGAEVASAASRLGQGRRKKRRKRRKRRTNRGWWGVERERERERGREQS